MNNDRIFLYEEQYFKSADMVKCRQGKLKGIEITCKFNKNVLFTWQFLEELMFEFSFEFPSDFELHWVLVFWFCWYYLYFVIFNCF